MGCPVDSTDCIQTHIHMVEHKDQCMEELGLIGYIVSTRFPEARCGLNIVTLSVWHCKGHTSSLDLTEIYKFNHFKG